MVSKTTLVAAGVTFATLVTAVVLVAYRNDQVRQPDRIQDDHLQQQAQQAQPLRASTTVGSVPRLIHFGWDNTRIWSLHYVLPKLNSSVFDGMTISSSQYTEIFSATAYPSTIIDDDKDELDRLPRRQRALLEHSYMLVHSKTDGIFDWTNETHWTNTLSNLRLLVQLAKYANLRGIVYDMEPYGKSPWDYSTQSASDTLDWTQMSTLVRQRGRTMMDVLQAEHPGLELWCLYGLSALDFDYSEADDFDAQAALQASGYGLWAPFFNGWIDNLASTTSLVDGNEPSYYFTRTQNYTHQKRHVRYNLDVFLDANSRTKYHTHVTMSHAVYVDAVMNTHDSPKFIGYYFPNDGNRSKLLRSNTLQALQSTESIVWVYSEINQWWQGTPSPRADKALRNAKADHGAGTSPPPPWPALRRAEQGVKNAKSIGGTFQSSNGQVYQVPTSWGTELGDNACVTWGDRGQYSCTFPHGTTVTIAPVVKGHVVDPPSRTFPSLHAHDWNVDWVVSV